MADVKTAWDFLDTALTIGGTLMAVWLGAAYAESQANRRLETERDHKLTDDATARHRDESALEGRRASVRLVLALHLEAFAEACATTISDNDDYEMEQASSLPDFKPWPDVDWGLLGAKETAEIRDIEVRVRMRGLFVRGDVRESAFDAQEAAGFYSDGAAVVGLEAWEAAEKLRKAAGASSLEFPPDGGGWNYTQTLYGRFEHMAKREEPSPGIGC